jgi:ATP-dependent DNA helicase Rep
LQISYCLKRRQGKEWKSCEPSRFIAELPQGEVVFAGAVAGGAAAVSKQEGMDRLARLKAMLG